MIELDDIAAFDVSQIVTPVARFERVARDTASMAEIAEDLRARQAPHGFLPAWFEEPRPNWHLYANAMALIVFALEHERTQDADLLRATRSAAAQLVRLQALSGRDGAWDDRFDVDASGQLALRDAGLRAVWVGSTAWAGLALVIASNVVGDPAGDYRRAIETTVGFFRGVEECRAVAGLPAGSVTEGTEGNISSFFFVDAARVAGVDDAGLADRMATYIAGAPWDALQGRFHCGVRLDWTGVDLAICAGGAGGAIVGPVATSCLDVTANWGTAFWRRRGDPGRALAGLAYSRAIFGTRSFSDPAVAGIGDIAGPWVPTVEFGAGQWAASGGTRRELRTGSGARALVLARGLPRGVGRLLRGHQLGQPMAGHSPRSLGVPRAPRRALGAFLKASPADQARLRGSPRRRGRFPLDATGG